MSDGRDQAVARLAARVGMSEERYLRIAGLIAAANATTLEEVIDNLLRRAEKTMNDPSPEPRGLEDSARWRDQYIAVIQAAGTERVGDLMKRAIGDPSLKYEDCEAVMAAAKRRCELLYRQGED